MATKSHSRGAAKKSRRARRATSSSRTKAAKKKSPTINGELNQLKRRAQTLVAEIKSVVKAKKKTAKAGSGGKR